MWPKNRSCDGNHTALHALCQHFATSGRLCGLCVTGFIKSTATVSRALREQFRGLLQSALSITGDMGNVQLLDATGCHLQILCHYGFAPELLRFFNATHQGQAACYCRRH
jgi:hypothetical protein